MAQEFCSFSLSIIIIAMYAAAHLFVDKCGFCIFVASCVRVCVQWNPSKVDTIGTKNFVRCSEVSLAQGLVVDHVPPIIAASYDKALLWTTKMAILMRDLSTDSS